VNDVNTAAAWNIYRTRFLIKAQQLTKPLAFVDALGREHRGQPGDYLVECSDGRRSIQRREIFEDIYVEMGPADSAWPSCVRRSAPLPSITPCITGPPGSA